MVQFCTAYCGILAKHTLCATARTGQQIADATGLTIHRFLSFDHGGGQQIAARIAYNEIDMVLCFGDPSQKHPDVDITYISRLCDQNNVPLRQQPGHRRDAGAGSGPGRPGLARHRQPQEQALHRVRAQKIHPAA